MADERPTLTAFAKTIEALPCGCAACQTSWATLELLQLMREDAAVTARRQARTRPPDFEVVALLSAALLVLMHELHVPSLDGPPRHDPHPLMIRFTAALNAALQQFNLPAAAGVPIPVRRDTTERTH